MKSLKEIESSTRIQVLTVGEDGGAGIISMPSWKGTVIWSFGGGWEHVSASPKQKRILPSWDDMCRLKDIFFEDEEWVVQFHPAKSEYVSNQSNCLHLWRPLEEKQPTPPSNLTGVKGANMAAWRNLRK